MNPWLFISLVVVVVLFFFSLGGGTVRERRHRRCRADAARVRNKLANGDFLPSQAFSYLRKINPYTFEELVLDGFERAGYRVKRNDSYSGDGGIDGRISKSGRRYLVQCKRYSGHISKRHVEQFSEVCRRKHAKGVFVHTGKTGKGSSDIASEMGNVVIMSGEDMLELIGYAKHNY